VTSWRRREAQPDRLDLAQSGLKKTSASPSQLRSACLRLAGWIDTVRCLCWNSICPQAHTVRVVTRPNCLSERSAAFSRASECPLLTQSGHEPDRIAALPPVSRL
jgi:hypothetical protein